MLLAACLATLGLSSPAHAQQTTAKPAIFAHLVLRAPDDCVDERALLRQVSARSDRIRFTRPASTIHDIVASIRRLPGKGVEASLVVVHPDGKRSRRRIPAAHCAEAAEALGLIIAVTLDPAADLGTEGVRSTPSASSPASAGRAAARENGSRPVSSVAEDLRGAETAGASEETVRGPADTQPRPAPSPPRVASEAPVSAPTPRDVSESLPELRGVEPLARPTVQSLEGAPLAERDSDGPSSGGGILPRLGATVGAVGVLITGPAPALMPGVGGYGEVRVLGDSIWSPALRITGLYATRSGFEEAGGTASFRLTNFSADLCPIVIAIARFSLRPCARGNIGRLQAQGMNTAEPMTVNGTWSTAGVANLLFYDLGNVVSLTALGAVEATLRRDSFQFPPEVFHRVPRVSSTVAFGAGFRFP